MVKVGRGEARYLDVKTAAGVSSGDDNSSSQGDDEHFPAAVPVSSMNMETAFAKGIVQEPAYRDKWFAVAFLLHLGVMISVLVLYATGVLSTIDDQDVINSGGRRLDEYFSSKNFTGNAQYDGESYEYDAAQEKDVVTSHFIAVFLICFCSAPLLAVFSMNMMATKAESLIQGSLFFAIGINILFGVLFSSALDPLSGLGNFFVAAILACYTKTVWHRIPFAAANLKAAITCVKANLGMMVLGLLNIFFVMLWFFAWLYIFLCAMNSPWMKSQESEINVDDKSGRTTSTHEEEEISTEGLLAMLGLFLSFYWTLQVLGNVVHTSLAGTVGTWWFCPQEASSCCSRGLTDSLHRSLTYSFGSICLGSLIVAIVEAVRTCTRSVAQSRRGGILRLVAQCLLIWIERIAQYFNRWAFAYVGIYGYSYIEAGKNVYELFRQRGWTTIISDSLINRMLAMMCLCIGLVNVLVAVIFSIALYGTDGNVIWMSALFGFFTGFFISSVAHGVLVSAVDSIIVLFAEAPGEFKENHPELCQMLEDIWTQTWPDVFSPAPAALAHRVV